MRALLCCIAFVTILHARNLTPAWVALGPDGRNVARVVVETGDVCPVLTADGHALPMQRREPVPEGLQPACEAAIPAYTTSLKLAEQTLKLPARSNSVVVFGDTGCRVKGEELQACNDPNAWPFLHNIRNIAAAKPDLIVHVGDYLYRETVCPSPAKGCIGPNGDNWATWNTDFFEPAAAALANTPWVFTRGNHESCARSWRGWYYYLDPRPFTGKCIEQSDAWIASSGRLRIGVMDSARVLNPDTESAAYVPQVAAQLSKLSGHVDWVAVHHPLWAYWPNGNALGIGSRPLAAAWASAKPVGVRLIVSGHTHLFEFLAFGTLRPSQLVAGNGGTNLEDFPLKAKLDGETLFGAPVSSAETGRSFGHTEIHRGRRGWRVNLMDLDGKTAYTCKLPNTGEAHCGK